MKKTLLLAVAVFFAFSMSAQIFTKDFEDQDLTSGGWQAVSITGDQAWEVPSTTYGHNDTYCAKMTGFDGSSFENEDWLISPSFDADANTALYFNFWNASGYEGNALQLYYSNDFDGSDVAAATWTEITDQATWHDIATQDYWEWTNSGDIDLSSLTGTSVYLGFKFTSTTDGSSTWELDDIVLAANPTAIDNINNTVAVYPNPVVNVINSSVKGDIEVISVTGQVVKTAANTNSVDVANLEAGIYLVKVTSDEGTYTAKILKK